MIHDGNHPGYRVATYASAYPPRFCRDCVSCRMLADGEWWCKEHGIGNYRTDFAACQYWQDRVATQRLVRRWLRSEIRRMRARRRPAIKNATPTSIGNGDMGGSV